MNCALSGDSDDGRSQMEEVAPLIEPNNILFETEIEVPQKHQIESRRTMIFLLYTLLHEIPRTSWTKDRCGPSLMIHIIGQVIISLLELTTTLVAIDVLISSIGWDTVMVSSEIKLIVADCMIGGLMISIPVTSLLITFLIYAGVMVEVTHETMGIVGWQRIDEAVR